MPRFKLVLIARLQEQTDKSVRKGALSTNQRLQQASLRKQEDEIKRQEQIRKREEEKAKRHETALGQKKQAREATVANRSYVLILFCRRKK
jgi:hypothetical protein